MRYGCRLSILEPPLDKVRAFRSKYGFGGFSKQVYPHDPVLQPGPADEGQNPNNAIRFAGVLLGLAGLTMLWIKEPPIVRDVDEVSYMPSAGH